MDLSDVGNLTDARYNHQAVLIPNGSLSVIVFGGQGMDGQALASTEQLNYTTQNWTAVVSVPPCQQSCL